MLKTIISLFFFWAFSIFAAENSQNENLIIQLNRTRAKSAYDVGVNIANTINEVLANDPNLPKGLSLRPTCLFGGSSVCVSAIVDENNTLKYFFKLWNVERFWEALHSQNLKKYAQFHNNHHPKSIHLCETVTLGKIINKEGQEHAWTLVEPAKGEVLLRTLHAAFLEPEEFSPVMQFKMFILGQKLAEFHSIYMHGYGFQTPISDITSLVSYTHGDLVPGNIAIDGTHVSFFDYSLLNSDFSPIPIIEDIENFLIIPSLMQCMIRKQYYFSHVLPWFKIFLEAYCSAFEQYFKEKEVTGFKSSLLNELVDRIGWYESAYLGKSQPKSKRVAACLEIYQKGYVELTLVIKGLSSMREMIQSVND